MEAAGAQATNGMNTFISFDRLRALFEAFRQRNDAAFMKTAEAIVAEELAANHHRSARELQYALRQDREDMSTLAKVAELSPVPKDRRSGEDLLILRESSVTSDRVMLSKETAPRIARVLEEHRMRDRLLEHGFAPKHTLLFWGPPGTGKTLTAHLLARELGLPIAIVRLNAVISSFLGDTAAHLQRIFTRANNTPMVLLLDEVDALGKSRDDPNDVGELKRVVNSLLQAIDSFQSNQSILVAASNHQYLLDPALWRRFDDVINFPLPDATDRQRFLSFLLNGVQLRGSVAQLAQRTAGLSYADLEHVTVEAIKTMLLQERGCLRARDITDELGNWRRSVLAAKRKSGALAK